MTRIKQSLVAAITLITGVFAFGFFATVGLAVVGVITTLGAVGALAIALTSRVEDRPEPAAVHG
ncbi:MAG: hypothetical protein AAF968_00540 [Pseudomonadota bacterium]